MGFLSKLFGGGKQTVKQEIPGYVTRPATQASNRAISYANRPYEAYTGDTVAGLTNDQLDAYGIVRDASNIDNSGTFDDAIQRVSDAGGAPAESYSSPVLLEGIKGADGQSYTLQDYMNPYTDEVVRKALAEMDRDRDINARNIKAEAAIGGGLYDDRRAIEMSELRRNTLDRKANTAANLYHSAFSTAAGLKNTDANRSLDTFKTNASLAETARNRQIGSAGALANLTDAELNQMLKQAGALEAVGAGQQAQDQRELDDDYRRFLEARDWDKEMAQFLAQIANGLPAPVTQTTKNKSNPLSVLSNLAGSAFKAYAGMPG